MRYADYWCVPGCRNQVTPVVWRTAVHKSDSHATLCWREMDSNHRYRMRNNPFWLPPFGHRNLPSATKKRLFRARDRWFESISLQQTVCLSPAVVFEGQNPAFRAGLGCWLGDRVGRDARVFRYRTNWRQYLCRAEFQYRGEADEVGPSLTYGRSLNPDWAQAKPSTIR